MYFVRIYRLSTGKEVKNPLQKYSRKMRPLGTPHEEISNAAREVGQRRTRSWQLPHAELANAPQGNRPQSTLRFAIWRTKIVLSLPVSSKSLLANNHSQRETRFKPIFCLQGRKVPQEQKQAARERLPGKNVYKNRRPRWNGDNSKFFILNS